MTNENIEQKLKPLTGRQIMVRLGAVALLAGTTAALVHYKSHKPKEPTLVEFLAYTESKDKPVHDVQSDGSHHYKVKTEYGTKELIDRDNDGIPEESISLVDEEVTKVRSCKKLSDYLSSTEGREWGVRRELCDKCGIPFELCEKSGSEKERGWVIYFNKSGIPIGHSTLK